MCIMRKISSHYYLNITFMFPVSCVFLLTFTAIHNSKLYCCMFRGRIQNLRDSWWWLWMWYHVCSLGDLPAFWDSMHGLSYSRMSVNLFQTALSHPRRQSTSSGLLPTSFSLCVMVVPLLSSWISTDLPYISLAFRSEGC